MIHSTALDIANRLQRELAPHCEFAKCIIVGSVARRKLDVHDIELLVMPTQEEAQRHSLFGAEGTGKMQHCAGFRDVVARNATRILIGNPANGKLIRLWHQPPGSAGVQVELYCATPKNWGYIQFIRTGPKEFTARAMVKLKKLQYTPADGTIHRFGEEQDCSTEDRIFQMLPWKYVEPQLRK